MIVAVDGMDPHVGAETLERARRLAEIFEARGVFDQLGGPPASGFRWVMLVSGDLQTRLDVALAMVGPPSAGAA